jgi:hypothetical protein
MPLSSSFTLELDVDETAAMAAACGLMGVVGVSAPLILAFFRCFSDFLNDLK